MKQIISHSAEDTISFGEGIAKSLKKGSVITLHGPLGSGKTTIVKGIARGLGIEETITSPSFTLISEYEGSCHLYHMDLYRIDGIDEFEMLGVEELMYGQGITLIEWAEKIKDLLPHDRISISFKIGPEDDRTITVEGLEN